MHLFLVRLFCEVRVLLVGQRLVVVLVDRIPVDEKVRQVEPLSVLEQLRHLQKPRQGEPVIAELRNLTVSCLPSRW